MADTDVAKMKVVELKAWLADRNIVVPSRAKKQDLIDLVLQHQDAGESSEGELLEESTSEDELEAPASPEAKVAPAKMTIQQLISWCTDHEVQVPSKRQKKAFYVDLVTTASAKKAKAPSTAPSKPTSAVRLPAKKASSVSPRARRKLIDMPVNDDEDEDEDEDSVELSDEESTDEQESDVRPLTPGSKLRAAVVMCLVIGVMIAYAFWVYQTLQSGPIEAHQPPAAASSSQQAYPSEHTQPGGEHSL